MKITKSLLVFFCILLGTSCTLDLREDPNAVQPSQSLPSLIINSMQRNLAGLFNTASSNGMILSRLINSGGNDYTNIFNPQSFDGTWTTAYANILQDGAQLNAIADKPENGLARHAGMSRVISAYVLTLLVDSFGDVPYSKALLGSANFNPTSDDQATLYTGTILPMLDRAILDLKTPTVALGGYLNATAPAINDNYYDNNYTTWVRLANSLKLKIYLNLRMVDPATATTGINAILASSDGYISSSTHNFVWHYGINTADPDSRHPRFIGGYPAGGGDYQSNWLMWQMFHGYDAVHNGASPGDPRMRFYFNRQVVSNSSNANEIRCVSSPIPSHYPSSAGTAISFNVKAGVPPGIGLFNSGPSAGMPDNTTVPGQNYNPLHASWNRSFCFPTNVGYWGRDHVDNQGIPPDGFLRTAYGVYPAGGKFDQNAPASVTATQGMKGAGIQPIMMRSNVNFMLAEAALYLSLTGALTPIAYYQLGIENSMDDVRTFATTGVAGGLAVISAGEGTAINTYYPAGTFTTDRNNYVTNAKNAYTVQTTPDAKMNYIAREHWISLFGNGVEAYNLYRRTGMPTGMQPTINSSSGAFVRSYYYPQTYATLNSNAKQKTDQTTKIFWDKGPSNLDF